MSLVGDALVHDSKNVAVVPVPPAGEPVCVLLNNDGTIEVSVYPFARDRPARDEGVALGVAGHFAVVATRDGAATFVASIRVLLQVSTTLRLSDRLVRVRCGSSLHGCPDQIKETAPMNGPTDHWMRDGDTMAIRPIAVPVGSYLPPGPVLHSARDLARMVD